MDDYARHKLVWNLLYPPVRLWAKLAFRYSCEPIRQEGPYMLIVNHVSEFDVPLVGIATQGKPVYIVATEQLLRGKLGRFFHWMGAPIARRKGAAAFGTVKECLRHLKEGRSVCIFAEGEQSWDGRSIPVVAGTGSLAQAARVPLVLYRLEGGYLTKPRWGRGIRKGRIQGRVAGVYAPEELAGMSKEEMLRLINEGIRENAWERQAKEQVRYKGRHPAEYLEKLLYLCPQCSCVGTLKSEGDRLSCDCGLNLRYSETGFFEPAKPFSNLAEWEDWQKEQLHQRHFEHSASDGCLFSDDGCTLSRITEDNQEEIKGTGMIAQYEDRLVCAGMSFEMKDVSDMACSQSHLLMFSAGENYYQVRSQGTVNLRKYLEIWKGFHAS